MPANKDNQISREKQLGREIRKLKAENQKLKRASKNSKKDGRDGQVGGAVETALQRLYAILSNTYFAVLLVTDGGLVEFANEAFCKVFDLSESPEELKGITAQEMIKKIRPAYAHPEESIARIAQIVSEGRRVKGEEVLMADGRLCLRDYAPIRIAGKSYGRAWYHQDITERKQAEIALENTLQRFYHMLSSMYSGLLLMTEDGHIEFVNQAFCDFYGLKESAELVGMASADLLEKIKHAYLHPDEAATRIVEILKRRQPVKLEEFTMADGRAAVRDFIPLIVEGKSSGRFWIHTDITERKLMEESLRQSERLYRAIGESIDYGVWVCAPDGRNIYASESFLKMVGITQEECSDFGWGNVLHPDDAEKTIAAWQECVRTGAVWDIEHRFRGADGQWHYVLARGVPVRDEQGNITCWAGINLDISGLKQAQQSLQEARDELELRVQERTSELFVAYDKLKKETEERRQAEDELRQAQKMEAIGSLAGGIAHDFNNMLAVILGNAELAIDDLEYMDEPRHNVEQIAKAAKRGRDLVKQILTFSRKGQEARKPLQLTPLVKETFKLLRSSLPSTIEMSLDITTKQDSVLADPVQIQQVIMNLATNAAHAMREGQGRLSIGLSNKSTNGDASRYVQLTVTDTGTGMSDEVKNRIFDPFFTTKEPGQGTGMGLAVVYGIVDRHEGRIEVESEKGKGSTFTVLFPMIHAPGHREDEMDAPLVQGKEHILFVDDEPFLVEMAQSILERLGYQVTTSTDSQKALDIFLADPHTFDLVITDHTMPHITGTTLAERMRGVRPDMPIILCTGYSETVSPEKAQEIGITEFLMKPLTKTELAGTIRRVLDGGNS